jgi:hypothetical protein
VEVAQVVKPLMPMAKTLSNVVKSSSGSSKVLAHVRPVGKVFHSVQKRRFYKKNSNAG